MRFCEHTGCDKPVFGTDKKTRTGYCKTHQYLRTDISKESIIQRAITKQREGVAERTKGKLRELATIAPDVKAPKDYAVLERWFKERQREMVGRCANCSGKSEAHTKMYKCSIGHILPKAYFPSVATHPDNWIELCFYGNSCHTNFDNKMLDLIDMNCFDQIITKFAKMYPFIAQDEKRRIPPILIEYLKTEL